MTEYNNTWDHARAYVKAGIYVNPVYVARKPDGKKDVRPVGLWRQTSSNSLADVAAWEQQYPDAGLLIDTGKSGLVVVDCDGADGMSNWAALIEATGYADTAPLWMVRTASGGEHWYYRAHPDHVIGNDQNGKVAAGVDIRGLGGFVIAPPTMTADGLTGWHGMQPPAWDLTCTVPAVVVERMKARPAAGASAAGASAAGASAAGASAAGASAAGASAAGASAAGDDLFDEPAREFTREQARDYVKKARKVLAATTSGYNGAINNFAMACAHFPWLVDRALCAALAVKSLAPQTGWVAPDRDDIATVDSAYAATEQGRSWVATQVEAGAPAVGQADAETVETATGYTDAVLAGKLADDLFRGVYAFTDGAGWRRWDGTRYAAVSDKVPKEDARRWVLREHRSAVEDYLNRRDQGKEVAEKMSDDPRVAGWTRAQGAGRLDAFVKLAAGHEAVYAKDSDFDADPDLLNTPAGVYVLRTGETLPHSPEYRMTKLTRGNVRPELAGDPLLKQALYAFPEDTHDWLQVRMGEACTGYGGKELLVLDGVGDNGKTGITGGLRRALGDYAGIIPSSILLGAGERKGAATPEKMELRGLRFGFIEETPDDGHLDAVMVKTLFDAEEIKGRQLFGQYGGWKPSHSAVMNTNHIPRVTDTDHGAWRRLKRIRCPYRFRDVDGGQALETEYDRPADVTIKQRMAETQEGSDIVLTWAVAGAARFLAARSLAQACPEPVSVKEAVGEWRLRSDDILRMVGTVVRSNSDRWVVAGDLYKVYAADLKAKGQVPPSAPTFYERLRNHSAMAGKVIFKQMRVTEANPPSRPNTLWLAGSALHSREWGFVGLEFCPIES